jgi:integrase
LTGQRVREVADAHWSEFDLGEGIWTIPQDRHKASVNHVVMLPAEAVELLQQLPRGTHGDVVFSWDGGRSSPKSNFNYAKRAIGHFMESALGGPISSPWVTHDIRRTVRTKLAELQVNDVIADIVLGHGRRGMTRVYNRYRYKREVAEALRLWCDHLMQLVGQSGSSTRTEPIAGLPAGARELPLHDGLMVEDDVPRMRWLSGRR